MTSVHQARFRINADSLAGLVGVAMALVCLGGGTTSLAQPGLLLDDPLATLSVESATSFTDVHVADETAWNVDLVGSWIGGECGSIKARDFIAFCGVPGGLIIIDFSSRGTPVEIASLPLPGGCFGYACNSVDLSGSYAYVANSWAGLRIVDISDPATPRETGFRDTDGISMAVAVSGHHAYVADHDNGLRIIDVSDPENPVEVGAYEPGGEFHDVTVRDGYAYVADRRGGLRIVDISDPTDPVGVSQFGTFRAASVDVSGGYAFVGTHEYDLRVIDISDVNAPVEAGSHPTRLEAVSVVVSGDYAYVADIFSLIVFDISDPTAPQRVQRLSSRQFVENVAVSDGLVYVANAKNGARVLDLSDPASPQLLDTYLTGSGTSRATVNGDVVYLPQSEKGLWALDVADPESPTRLAVYSNLQNLPWIGLAAARDGYGYVIGSTFQVLDISDPESLSLIGSVYLGDRSYDTVLDGDYAYVANGFDGLRIIDIADPGAPSVVGTQGVPDQAQGVAVGDGYAFITTPSDLRVIDVSAPDAPVEVGSLDLGISPGRTFIALEGDRAFVTSGFQGYLHVIDVSDPASPKELTRVRVSDLEVYFLADVAVSGDHVYVASSPDGLYILNVSDPTQIVEEGFYQTSGLTATFVTLSDDLVWLSDVQSGLVVLRFPQRKVTGPYLDIRPGECPNPLNVSLPQSGNANGGVLPVAVLGSAELDVRGIDVSSLELEGVLPLRHGYKDVAGPGDEDADCPCSVAGPDGYTDLTLKFSRLDVVSLLGDASGSDVPLTLTGLMQDGTPIELTDCVRIVPPGDQPSYAESDVHPVERHRLPAASRHVGASRPQSPDSTLSSRPPANSS